MPKEPNSPEPDFPLEALPGMVSRQGPRFLATSTAVTAALILLSLLITPVYESEASFRVRMQENSGLESSLMSGLGDVAEALPGGLSLPGGLGETDVQTEIGILRSRSILEPQAEALALHESLKRPWRTFRSEIFSSVIAGEDAPQGTFTLKRAADGRYRVTARGTREAVDLPDFAEPGTPFRIGPMSFTIHDSLSVEPPRVIKISVRPFRRTMRALRKRVKIQRSDMGSRLIELQYRNADPAIAQAFVNGVAEDFVSYSLSTSQSDARREVAILSEQVEHFSRELARVESELERFQERERVIVPEAQATAQIERIAEVQVLRDALQVEHASLTEMLESLASLEPRPGEETPFRALASFPSFITNEGVQQLLLSLIDLENQRSDLLTRRSEANADVAALQGRIRSIEEQLLSIAHDYRKGLDTQLASTEVALRGFDELLQDIPPVELEYARRKRDQGLLSQVYLSLQARLVDARVAQAVDDSEVRLIDTGIIEDRPAFPRRSITWLLSGILGLLVALFSTMLLESSGRSSHLAPRYGHKSS